MDWDEKTYENFKKLINQAPVFSRKTAERLVSQKAEGNAKARGSNRIEGEDMIKAFLSETPGPFKRRMFADMEKFGIDYIKYQK
ncbi:hypothetical protein L6386_02555 [bacterium]|nr:hypothetical protein [bacterium]MBU4560655.1 hypothetical protein [bacterium]MCG2676423.1 hypothetical protein [bacterium]MCG2677430.1 hypothetical protein [bacterium]